MIHATYHEPNARNQQNRGKAKGERHGSDSIIEQATEHFADHFLRQCEYRRRKIRRMRTQEVASSDEGISNSASPAD